MTQPDQLVIPDMYGEQSFSRGLAAYVDEDMRIRTRIGQLTDSGRYTSAGPNMTNQHKRMESELRCIFSQDEKALRSLRGWAGLSVPELQQLGLLPPEYEAIRSCFMAPPGWVMLEADYRQAELNVLAFLAGDPALIAIVTDPTRDLHSEMAVKAFRLTCSPGEVKKLHENLRVAAKAVVFGIAYGRGAGAIVRQLRAAGITITKAEAQGMIDTFFELFPLVADYVDRCKRAVHDVGYVETAWGRRRYFTPTGDDSIDAGMEREAVNHPIQGTVAGCLDIAMHNLQQYRKYVEPQLTYQIVLPVHDAVLLYVRPQQAKHVLNVVLPVCMSHGARVDSLGLTLAIDADIKLCWSDHLRDSDVEALLERVAKQTEQ